MPAAGWWAAAGAGDGAVEGSADVHLQKRTGGAPGGMHMCQHELLRVAAARAGVGAAAAAAAAATAGAGAGACVSVAGAPAAGVRCRWCQCQLLVQELLLDMLLLQSRVMLVMLLQCCSSDSRSSVAYAAVGMPFKLICDMIPGCVKVIPG